MKPTMYILALPVFLAISACSGNKDNGNNSVDKNGNCTQEYVNDYNNVNFEVKTTLNKLQHTFYTESEKDEAILKTQNACQNFLSKHRGASCRAEINYQEVTVSSDKISDVCSTVNSIAESRAKQKTETNTTTPKTNDPISTVDDLTLFTSLNVNQIQIKIIDKEAFKKLISDSTFVSVRGKIDTLVNLRSEVLAGETFCSVLALDKALWTQKINDGQVELNVASKEEKTLDGASNLRRVTLVFEDSSIGIDCGRRNAISIMVKNMRDALQGIAEVVITK